MPWKNILADVTSKCSEERYKHCILAFSPENSAKNLLQLNEGKEFHKSSDSPHLNSTILADCTGTKLGLNEASFA